MKIAVNRESWRNFAKNAVFFRSYSEYLDKSVVVLQLFYRDISVFPRHFSHFWQPI